MAKIYRRIEAKRDLVHHFVYLAEHAELDTAERFLTSADASFESLATHPLVGSPLTVRNPALTGIRKWRIKGFENHLIFYLSRKDGISIVRVLHAAQDWWSLLGIDN